MNILNEKCAESSFCRVHQLSAVRKNCRLLDKNQTRLFCLPNRGSTPRSYKCRQNSFANFFRYYKKMPCYLHVNFFFNFGNIFKFGTTSS